MSDSLFSPESGAFPTDTDFFDQAQVIRIPELQTIVPSWYKRHTAPSKTIVKQGGKPVAPGFLVAEVAPELRWAIGEDGEVLGQLEFRQAHEVWYTAQYQAAGQPSDDPNLRPIPRVERFVARRVDPSDPTRLQPILRPPKEPAPPIQPLYNAAGDLIEEAGEISAPAGAKVKPPSDRAAPVAVAPDATEAEVREARIANGKDPDYKTPCGKAYPAGAQYIKQHTRWCESPECNTEE